MIDGKHLTKPPKDWQPQTQDARAGTAYIEVTASSDPEHGEAAPTGSALASGRSAGWNLAFCLTFSPETARVVGELMQVSLLLDCPWPPALGVSAVMGRLRALLCPGAYHRGAPVSSAGVTPRVTV